jgi:hypothetical protein
MSAVDNLSKLGYDVGSLKTSTFLNGVLGGLGTVQAQKLAQTKAESDAELKKSQADYYSGRNQASVLGAATRADATTQAAKIRSDAMGAVQGLKADALEKYGVTKQETDLLKIFLNPENAGAYDQGTMDQVGGIVQKIFKGRMNDTFGAPAGSGPAAPAPYVVPGSVPPTEVGQPVAPPTSPGDVAAAPAPIAPGPQAPALMPAAAPSVMPRPVRLAPGVSTIPGMPGVPMATGATLSGARQNAQRYLMNAADNQMPASTPVAMPPGQIPIAPQAPRPVAQGAPPMPPSAGAPTPYAPPAASVVAPAAPPTMPAAAPVAPVAPGTGFTVRPGIKQTTAADRVAATNKRTEYLANDSTVKAMNALDKEYTDQGMSDQMYLAALGRIAPEMVAQIAKVDPATGRVHMLIQPGKLMQAVVQEKQTNGAVKLYLAPSEAAKNLGAANQSNSVASTLNPALALRAQASANEGPSRILLNQANAQRAGAQANLYGIEQAWKPQLYKSLIDNRTGRLDVAKIIGGGHIQEFLIKANQPILDMNGQPVMKEDGKTPATPANTDPAGVAALQATLAQMNPPATTAP